VSVPVGARRRRLLLGAATGAGLVAAGFAAYALLVRTGGDDRVSASPPQAVVEKIPPIVSAAGLAQRNGIRIVHVALTGAGGLVDLRFQVLDSDKAASIHGAPPEMVDERTGAVVDQLLMGHSHKGALHVGQTYYLIFENPGDFVHHGSRVTVELGGLRVRHVAVQ
jgi:hypothetical protein